MKRIFTNFCGAEGLTFFYGNQNQLKNNTKVFHQDHSYFNTESLPSDFKGIHIIRHPLEIIVSGYRFHKKTDETWCSQKNREDLNFKTYQEYLNGISDDEGITFEMSQIAYTTLYDMYKWDYQDTRFLNIHLEEFSIDYDQAITKIFTFLGFDTQTVQKTIQLSRKYDKYSNENMVHITNQTHDIYTYQSYFKPHHYLLFYKLFPRDIFKKLNYEEPSYLEVK